MSTVADIITYARQIAQTDSNGLTDTLGLAFTNDAQNNYIRELLNRDIDAAQTQEAYTSMTTAGTYAWPDDMYALKTVEVDYTGLGGQNYIQADAIDVSNIQDVSFDYLRKNQSSSSPLIDNRGDTFEVFPTPLAPSTNGIRIFYWLEPTEFTSTSDSLGYPITLDYRCLACRVAALFATRAKKYDMAEAFNAEFEKRTQDVIRILASGTQQPLKPEPLHITGWEF